MTEIIGFAKLDLDTPDFDDVTAFIDSNWQPHFNKNDYEGNWEVLTLRSPGGNPDSIFADLMGQTQFADTAYMDTMPSVKSLVSLLQCPVMSVRLLNLKAGAIIKQHRDAELARREVGGELLRDRLQQAGAAAALLDELLQSRRPDLDERELGRDEEGVRQDDHHRQQQGE